MKNLLRLLLLTFLGAASASAQTLTMEIDSLVAEIGTTVRVDLTIDDAVTNLRGYSLHIRYRHDLVQLNGVWEGPLFLEQSPTYLWWDQEMIDERHSLIQVDHTLLGNETPVNGPGIVLMLSLTGLTCGIEELVISDSLFRDMDNAPIAITCTNLEHQVCQIPHLDLEIVDPGRQALLTWNRVLNSNWFKVWKSDEPYGPWSYYHTTVDTFYVDPAASSQSREFYKITVDFY